MLGSSFMHNLYSVFDYGTLGPVASSKSSSRAASRGLKQQVAAASAAPPRVGLGELTAAEKAAAQAAFDRGLASKSSGAGGGGWSGTARCSLQAVVAAAVTLVLAAAL